VPDLVLLGPRGAGKTTLGRLVAKRLRVGFTDLDEQVEHHAGRSVADIFAAEGEVGFRDREADRLRHAARSSTGILATGGGVIVRPGNRTILQAIDCPRVLLLADPASLVDRIGHDPNRPPLTDLDAAAEVQSLLEVRMAHYLEVATATVHTDHATQDEVVTRIAEIVL
jgi:shikimate kinase